MAAQRRLRALSAHLVSTVPQPSGVAAAAAADELAINGGTVRDGARSALQPRSVRQTERVRPAHTARA